MKNVYVFFILCLFACKSSSEIEVGIVSMPDCKKPSPFISSIGMNANTAAFSTSEKKVTGICLLDVTTGKIYQHPSWKEQGNMGPMAIDERGNVFVAPIPFVNVLESVRKNQNIIYKVNATTGVLETVLELTQKSENINTQNPYGIVGLFYDCQSQLLYASSVYGSTRTAENGKIYCIDTKQNPIKIIDEYKGVDAMGIGISLFNDKKYLFYGNARDHNIYRIELKENGLFTPDHTFCFSLEGIGKRGDDIAKKIRFTKRNSMQITGAEFYYNLTAPTQQQEDKYEFIYNVNDNQWQESKIQP